MRTGPSTPATFQSLASLKKVAAYFFNMLRQLQELDSSSTESVEHQNEPVSCKLRYKILESGLDALPGYVTEAEDRVQLLKMELFSTHHAKKKA